MSQQEKISSQAVVITGMHRSGTSLTASVLEKAGLDIGKELLGPSSGNRQGHFEDVNILSLHQNILISQGISAEGWTTADSVDVPQQFLSQVDDYCRSRSHDASLWGWKEPRTTLFLNFWNKQLPNAKFVLVYRSPWEVVDSLFTRGDIAFHNNPNFALEVWRTYNQAILNFYGHHSEQCFLLHPLALRRSENDVINSLIQKLNLPLSQLENPVFQDEEMHFEVNKTHRPLLLAHFFPEALEIYRQLEKVADAPSQENLDFDSAAQAAYQDWVCQDWFANRRANALLTETKSQLQGYQETQLKLQQTQADLQQTQAELQQRQSEIQQVKAALEKVQAELQQTQTKLQQTQENLNHSAQRIQAMESSKFWKLRNRWIGLKETLLPLKDQTSSI